MATAKPKTSSAVMDATARTNGSNPERERIFNAYRQWGYLEGDLDPLAQAQAQEDSETRESYTDLRTRWGVDNSEDDPYPRHPASRSPSPSNTQSHSRAHSPTKHSTKGKGKEKEQQIVYPNGLTHDLKSITELRSKGESRRFLDELGYLFEGLEPSGGVGVRRSRCFPS